MTNIRSVERTIAVLEVLASHSDGARLIDVSEETGLNASTTLRFLQALESLGYAVKSPSDGRYLLGPRASRLGHTTGVLVLQSISKPYMEKLMMACGEDVNLGILDGKAVLCIETERSSNILGVNFSTGLRIPLHASSLGKAILAYMPEDKLNVLLSQCEFERLTPTTIVSKEAFLSDLYITRQRGYAIDREENIPGVVCIGAPVFDMGCEPVAALSITAPSQRISCDELELRYAGLLVDTANAISAALVRNNEFVSK